MSMNKYESRYYVKRKIGISNCRKDGSFYDPDVDNQAGYAEEFAAKELGSKVNDSVLEGGDNGFDFEIKTISGIKRVDVVWNGFIKGTKKPRLNGNLIVNPFEPHRYRNTDVFILVIGSIDDGFKIVGWATTDDVKRRPQKNFGYGNRYWVPIEELRDISSL